MQTSKSQTQVIDIRASLIHLRQFITIEMAACGVTMTYAKAFGYVVM